MFLGTSMRDSAERDVGAEKDAQDKQKTREKRS